MPEEHDYIDADFGIEGSSTDESITQTAELQFTRVITRPGFTIARVEHVLKLDDDTTVRVLDTTDGLKVRTGDSKQLKLQAVAILDKLASSVIGQELKSYKFFGKRPEDQMDIGDGFSVNRQYEMMQRRITLEEPVELEVEYNNGYWNFPRKSSEEISKQTAAQTESYDAELKKEAATAKRKATAAKKK